MMKKVPENEKEQKTESEQNECNVHINASALLYQGEDAFNVILVNNAEIMHRTSCASQVPALVIKGLPQKHKCSCGL